jgi:hypothetical protein
MTDLTRVERRMFDLLAVTGELAAARTRDEAARLTIERGMHAVGAVMGALWIPDVNGSELQLLASSDPDPGSGIPQRMSLACDTPLAFALRRRARVPRLTRRVPRTVPDVVREARGQGPRRAQRVGGAAGRR